MTIRSLPIHSPVLLVSLATGLLFSSCVTKSEHQALQQQLTTCEQEAENLTAQVEDYRSRYEQELRRWQATVEDYNDLSETTLSEVDNRIEGIRGILPAMMQEQLDGRLNELVGYVEREFISMSRRSQQLQESLEETQEKLSNIESTMATQEGLSHEIRALDTRARERRRSLARQLNGLVDAIQEYDRTRLDCKQCDEYLSLRRKKEDDLANFHRSLIRQINELRTAISSGPPLEGEGEADS